jgi:hypothetical protein
MARVKKEKKIKREEKKKTKGREERGEDYPIGVD